MNQLISFVSRVLFVGAFGLAAVAVTERLANAVGYTVLGGAYAPSRLLEIAATALLFVVALLLRDIRQAVQARSLGTPR